MEQRVLSCGRRPGSLESRGVRESGPGWTQPFGRVPHQIDPFNFISNHFPIPLTLKYIALKLILLQNVAAVYLIFL